MDPFLQLGVIYDPDHESLTRLYPLPCITTAEHNSLPNQQIFTQDFPLNPAHKTWLRVLKPINPPPNTKLPLILYFHGSGFILYSAFTTVFHDFCAAMAKTLPAVIVSVGYRLAPENRLPAAYDDAVEAINWIKKQALDPSNECLFNNIADFSNCYLMGSSAGGNIAYHTALRALSLNLKPLVIRGVILDQPFFGGQQRTPSELSLANQNTLQLVATDVMWELALPKGSNRDHEYCNPLLQKSFNGKIRMIGRCFILVGGRDILADRDMELAKMLEENEVDVVTLFLEEVGHGSMLDEKNVQALCEKNVQAWCVALKDFVKEKATI